MGTASLVDRRQLAMCHQMQGLVTSFFSGGMLNNNSGVNLIVPGATDVALWSCDHKNEHFISSLKVNMSNWMLKIKYLFLQ